jgi:hypothetical protein
VLADTADDDHQFPSQCWPNFGGIILRALKLGFIWGFFKPRPLPLAVPKSLPSPNPLPSMNPPLHRPLHASLLRLKLA